MHALLLQAPIVDLTREEEPSNTANVRKRKRKREVMSLVDCKYDKLVCIKLYNAFVCILCVYKYCSISM